MRFAQDRAFFEAVICPLRMATVAARRAATVTLPSDARSRTLRCFTAREAGIDVFDDARQVDDSVDQVVRA